MARLRNVGGRLETAEGAQSAGPKHGLFLYRSRERELSLSLELPCPWIVLILRGSKRVDDGHLLDAVTGDVLLLPGGVPLNVVNFIDPDTGVYEALCVEAQAEALALLRRNYPDVVWILDRALSRQSQRCPADVATLQAFEHVCATALAPRFDPRVLHHRIEGLLLALAVQGAASRDAAAAAQARTDLGLAIRNLVRAEPAKAWNAEELARRLRLSQATMRRRLAASGTHLRALISDERMTLGRILLADPSLAVADVALRCGYESPAKFSRQFTRWAGVRPSAWRARHQPPPACDQRAFGPGEARG